MNNKAWTEDEDREIKESLRRGILPIDIAKTLGRSYDDIMYRVKSLFGRGVPENAEDE